MIRNCEWRLFYSCCQVRRLELEREELLTTIESLKTRHNDEMANIDTSHK